MKPLDGQKVEPQPTSSMTINSYLRKKHQKTMNSGGDMEKDAAASIKAKYSEQKPLSFKQYADKIKAKYVEPEQPSDESKVADIKSKFHEEEKAKIDAPAKMNTRAVSSQKKSEIDEKES